MSDLNRRQFVVATLTAAACACLCGAETEAAPTTAPVGGIDIGTLADFPTDGIYDKFIKSNKLAVIRNDGKLYACSARCTHQGALLNVHDKEFVCPKHNSQFSIQGTVISGKAKSSLERYAISKNAAGHVLVDMSKSFREKNWDDATSFIVLK